MKKLGLIINPIAGMGGRVGLKGTDGLQILEQSRNLGAKPLAQDRAVEALRHLVDLGLGDSVQLVTCPGGMGADAAARCGFSPEVLEGICGSDTTAADTKKAARQMAEMGLDLILFVGGDGTARDIYEAIGSSLLVLGVPAGVKIHSAVYACNPVVAGRLAGLYLLGRVKKVVEAEVMDIDEDSFRKQILSARLYGYLRIPFERRYVQGLKVTSGSSEEHSQKAIAFEVAGQMSDEFYYVIGPGTTTRAVMQELGLECSLLGVDLVYRRGLAGLDLNESQLLQQLRGRKAKLIITPVGGQGFILGRGNQQLSPEVIRLIGRDNIIIIATRQKMNSLNGKSLLVDTGDSATDVLLAGYFKVITGYREAIVYKIACLEDVD